MGMLFGCPGGKEEWLVTGVWKGLLSKKKKKFKDSEVIAMICQKLHIP